jgi:hypothetical protein
MQKNKGAYILIWSLFLSLFISFAFVSISISVNKSIKWAGSIETIIDSFFERNTIFFDTDFQEQTDWKETVSKDWSNTVTLKRGSSTEIRFEWTNLITFSVSVNSGGPLFYSFLAFSDWGSQAVITSSGTIEDLASFNGNLDSLRNRGILYFKNLWWYWEFTYNSSSVWINASDTFTVDKEIWGENYEKTWMQKTNFSLWDNSSINYETYEMDF